MKRHCPECRQILDKTDRDCFCGWQQPHVAAQADHRCHYAISQRRCPLSGTISPYSNKWLCRRHYGARDDPKRAEAELIYIEENYQKIIDDEYVDWRRKLFK